MSRNRIYKITGAVATVFLLLVLAPKFLPEMKIHLATEIMIFALFAVSFNLLYGYGGMLAFGFAAFFGFGAYATALIISRIPAMPLLLTLAIAALSGFVMALLIGPLAVRLKGTYFALITFAFQMFLYAIALKWRDVTNGDDGIGIARPDLYLPFLGNLSMAEISNLYYVTLALVALGIIACYLFLKTPLGNSIMCIRDNDVRSSFLGYSVYLTKVTVFCLSGFLAGLAGGLFVLFNEFVATNCIDLSMSFLVVLMALVGGTGQFLGPILGAAFYITFQDWVSSLTQRWWLFIGALYVVVILYIPDGLISLFKSERIRLFGNRKRG